MISKYDAITFDFKVFVILCAIALEENIIGTIPVTEMVTKQSLQILVYPRALARGIYKNEKALLCNH